jgi:hypothetical protein
MPLTLGDKVLETARALEAAASSDTKDWVPELKKLNEWANTAKPFHKDGPTRAKQHLDANLTAKRSLTRNLFHVARAFQKCLHTDAEIAALADRLLLRRLPNPTMGPCRRMTPTAGSPRSIQTDQEVQHNPLCRKLDPHPFHHQPRFPSHPTPAAMP